jgi:hypothetical protein
MFGDQKDTQKNLKDSSFDQSLVIKDTFIPISYRKTNKLISALYMVTDIMDREEPLRNKLRTLGVEIISDIYALPGKIEDRIQEIVSFLDIASTINLISEMNYNILKKEFLELHKSLAEYTQIKQKPISLEDFLTQSSDADTTPSSLPLARRGSIGHAPARTRIGVQKGSTFKKALSDKVSSLSDSRLEDFNNLKNERRANIIRIIKDNKEGATIKDIRISIKDKGAEALHSLGEKTLQRELASMVKDNVLSKLGEKRWSKYYVKTVPGGGQ